MKNKIGIWIIVGAMFGSLMTGCEKNKIPEINGGSSNAKTYKSKIITLNERQKQILKDNGLPEEYDKLTDSQKNAIVKIEGVLKYLEDTYHDKFEYKGYVSGGIDGEYVAAEISGSFPEKIVIVDIDYQDDKYIYSDNYKELMSTGEYTDQVSEFLKKYFNEEDFKVYVEISKLKDSGDSIIERAVACPVIYVRDSVEDAYIEKTAKEYGDWIVSMSNKNGGGADFRVLLTDDFEKVEEANYKDYFEKNKYWLSLSVYSDKKIEIKRY